MIDFKNGVLTIDTSLSVADSQAISAFADTVRNGEMERIIKLLEDLYLKRDADGNVLDTKHNEDLLYVIALIKGEEQ